MTGNRAEQTWDAGTYDQRYNFVWRYGAELIDLLQPRAGEEIPSAARNLLFAGVSAC